MDELRSALKKLAVTEPGSTLRVKKRMLASTRISITTAKVFAKNAIWKIITERGY